MSRSEEIRRIAQGLHFRVSTRALLGERFLAAPIVDRAGASASATSSQPEVERLAPPGAGGTPVAGPRQAPEAIGAPAPVAPGSLASLAEAVAACTRCSLSGCRTQTVFGEGAPGARLLFVGEGPGAEEDRLGRPFVGPAGKLLDRMIGAMGLDRAQVYIANVVKCRPPGNRVPLPDEMAACAPYLLHQIEAVAPDVIVLLGATALRALFPTAAGIVRERGRWRVFHGIDTMPTFHPAYLLRNPAEKLPAWEDLKAVLGKLALPVPSNPADKR